MWVMRLVSPTFNICDSIIYNTARKVLRKQRGSIIQQLRLNRATKAQTPWSVSFKPFDMNNSGGNIAALAF